MPTRDAATERELGRRAARPQKRQTAEASGAPRAEADARGNCRRGAGLAGVTARTRAARPPPQGKRRGQTRSGTKGNAPPTEAPTTADPRQKKGAAERAKGGPKAGPRRQGGAQNEPARGAQTRGARARTRPPRQSPEGRRRSPCRRRAYYLILGTLFRQ